MNIKVSIENLLDKDYDNPVLEYTAIDATIGVDKSLTLQQQESLVIHGVIHAYCPNWAEGNVDELGELIADALRQLRSNNG